uniref:Ionotropic glutamate receptor C-terminal domain-containing protein n=1 Tax=Musca domestica TaxID=7370 RepID=A0A1I8N6Z1_MUSDO
MILNTSIVGLLSILVKDPANISENSKGITPEIVNHTFIWNIVHDLHKRTPFNDLVFFISENLMTDPVRGEFFHNFWQNLPQIPLTIKINNSQKLNGYLSLPSMCLVFTSGEEDAIMETTAASMKGIRSIQTIFVLYSVSQTEDTFEVVSAIFSWAWKKQFMNTLLITLWNNIFIYDPYPRGRVVNITDNWSLENLFNFMERKDFKGYVIHTPVQRDFPRVFYMGRQRASRRNTTKLSGISGSLFRAFMKSINATLNYTSSPEEPKNIFQIIELVGNKSLEISVNSYTAMFKTISGLSYPVGINDWCLMVPYLNRTKANHFLSRSFHPSTWALIGFSCLYISLGIWLCSPPRQKDLSKSFLQAICSLMLIAPLKVLQLRLWRMRLLFVLLFVFGFLLTNIYLSKMASLLTAYSEPQQINSIEDIIGAQLPIMMMDYEYEVLLSYNFPQQFMDLIITVNKSQMDEHRDRLNTSYAYSSQTDRWKFLDMQQRFLKTPLFRLSQICIGPFFHVFPVQKDSHLDKPLKDFIILASDMGLLAHWKKVSFADALFLGYVQMIKIDEGLMPLNLHFFRSIWIIWSMGLVLSAVVFLVELNWALFCKIIDLIVDFLKKLRNKIYEV